MHNGKILHDFERTSWEECVKQGRINVVMLIYSVDDFDELTSIAGHVSLQEDPRTNPALHDQNVIVDYYYLKLECDLFTGKIISTEDEDTSRFSNRLVANTCVQILQTLLVNVSKSELIK